MPLSSILGLILFLTITIFLNESGILFMELVSCFNLLKSSIVRAD